MESADHEVLRHAAEWLDTGETVYLVTVARTFGSSPRPPGSMLALRADGTFAGSVSGGCMEYDLARRARENELPESMPSVITYGIDQQEAQRFGLPCGGRLELVIERLAETGSLRDLLTAVDERRHIARSVDFKERSVRLDTVPGGPEFSWDGRVMRREFGPAWRLILTGAGQLSRFTAQMGLALGYDIVVCEPRTEIADQWDVPGTTLDRRMPDDVVLDLVHARCAVLALVHDPKLDDLALIEALQGPAFYVGALGSRLTNDKRRKRLTLFNLTAAQISRLHGPIGLHLGGKSPAEIALATLAGVTAARNGVDQVQATRPEQLPNALAS